MNITVVAGPRRSGKSTYIKENFPNAKTIRLPIHPFSFSDISSNDTLRVEVTTLRDIRALVKSLPWRRHKRGVPECGKSIPKHLVVESMQICFLQNLRDYLTEIKSIVVERTKIPDIQAKLVRLPATQKDVIV